jgi:hypothetical protein
MKLGKIPIILLVVGLLAGYYVLGTDYREIRHKYAALASQIAGEGQQLALIPPAPTDLGLRLDAVRSNLDMEINTFPAQLNTTLIVNDILKLAEATGVKAIPLITRPWATESVNQTDYPVFRLNLAVKGTFAHLSDFLNRLENGEPGTLVITDLKIDRVTGLPVAEETGDATEVEGSLDIAVYARPSVNAPVDKVESR